MSVGFCRGARLFHSLTVRMRRLVPTKRAGARRRGSCSLGVRSPHLLPLASRPVCVGSGCSAGRRSLCHHGSRPRRRPRGRCCGGKGGSHGPVVEDLFLGCSHVFSTAARAGNGKCVSVPSPVSQRPEEGPSVARGSATCPAAPAPTHFCVTRARRPARGRLTRLRCHVRPRVLGSRDPVDGRKGR